jgi:6-phosphogluconolactonase (cycloisomerase 2 family)
MPVAETVKHRHSVLPPLLLPPRKFHMKSKILQVTRCLCFAAVLAALTACGGGDSGSPTYTVGGTITGLAGLVVVLQNDSGDDLPINVSGKFTFATRVLSGTSYSVTVKTQPTPEGCTVANGAGTIAAADVTNVMVTCVGPHRSYYAVPGLMGSGLVIQLFTDTPDGAKGMVAASDPVQINSNGPFTFDHVFPGNRPFPTSIRITQQPASPTQLCVIQNAGLSIQAADVPEVAVVCSQFSYVANAGDNTVSAYTVDATSGALAAVGTLVETGTSPHAIVGTQDRQFVFMGNEGSNDISAFGVNSASGALTAVPGSPFAAGTDPKALALYRVIGTYLYVANAGSDTVSAFAVDMSSGSLTPLSPATFATGKGPSAIAVDPTGGFIYVANNGGSNDISAFSVNPATGILTPVAGSPFPAGANPLDLALGVAGKFLYTANPDATSASMSGFSVNSGTLTPLGGSPFPLAVSHEIATDRTGAYLYVTMGASIVGYGIDAATGTLTALAGFPVSAGANAYSVSIDPTNQFLYVANDGAPSVTGFRLDASTGALTPMPDSPFPAGNRPGFLATL